MDRRNEAVNEWIKVSDKLPDPFQVVWIYCRNKEVLLGCRTYDNDERYSTEPSEGWYSFEDEKCRWTHWWIPIRSSLDKPNPPQE